MAVISPPLPAKFFLKLHHRHPPSHLHTTTTQHLFSHTKFSIITTHNHRKKQTFQIVNAAAERSEKHEKTPEDFVVKPRKWNVMDITTAGGVAGMHVLCVFAPFTFCFGALWIAIGGYFVTGLLGITLSFHRNLSHKSFKLPKWLEYIPSLIAEFMLFRYMGNPVAWVSTHRYHHQYVDSERNPHSPIKGFWFSHMSWLFDTDNITRRCGEPNNVGDLEKQPFYRFLRTTYVVHPVALGLLLYALGGFPFIVWGMISCSQMMEPLTIESCLYPIYTEVNSNIKKLISLDNSFEKLQQSHKNPNPRKKIRPGIFKYQNQISIGKFYECIPKSEFLDPPLITWLVNSACHVWGQQAWDTHDLSRNNWWVGLLAFGEGWHNNHHAFEYSARHGLEWWQVDMTWYMIRFLDVIVVAVDVKLPSPSHIQKMAFPPRTLSL